MLSNILNLSNLTRQGSTISFLSNDYQKRKGAILIMDKEKWTQEQYWNYIQQKKQEAHDALNLYITLNAKELQEECEPGVKNLASACKAMLQQMLEGDCFEVEPKIHTKIAGKLTVRYYVDNLYPTRRTYAAVQEEAKAALEAEEKEEKEEKAKAEKKEEAKGKKEDKAKDMKDNAIAPEQSKEEEEDKDTEETKKE